MNYIQRFIPTLKTEARLLAFWGRKNMFFFCQSLKAENQGMGTKRPFQIVRDPKKASAQLMVRMSLKDCRPKSKERRAMETKQNQT